LGIFVQYTYVSVEFAKFIIPIVNNIQGMECRKRWWSPAGNGI